MRHYPVVLDTPGFRDVGNFTGHTLKLPPPICDPHLVARSMVVYTLRPSPSITKGGAATMVRLVHFLIPGVPLLSGWLTRLDVQRIPESEPSPGNLFAPPSGDRRIEGGWRAA